MPKTQDLSLSLKLDRESFFERESINLEATLLNNAATPIRVEEQTALNNSLYFCVVDKSGREFLGSLQSSRTKDELLFPPVSGEPMFLFGPNAKRVISVDLLEILGALPEGDYIAKAAYTFEGMWFVRSEPVSFKVLKSAPMYSKTFQDSLRATSNTIRTAWISKEKDGLHVFLMENSQYYPSNLKSNRRVLKIEEIQRTYPSVLGSADQDTEHFIWSQAGTVRVATLQQRVLRDVKAVKLKVPCLQILEPPFTTEDGKLHFVVTSREGEHTIFKLVSYSLEGKAEVEEICRFSGGFTKYCIIYDVEPRLHVAWASESGDISYTWFDLEKFKKTEGEPEMLVKGKPPILDVQISKACGIREGKLQPFLFFAYFEAPNELHSHLISVDSGETLLHSFFPLPEPESLVLIQTILDLECRPHYLFQDHHGALWFKAFEQAELVRVTEEGEAYPGNVDYPVLLVSSNLSLNYGIYLRYIKDGSGFVYKKLESLA
jgi:hypothetical protein